MNIEKAFLEDNKVKFIKEKSFKSKKLPVYIGLSEIYNYKNFGILLTLRIKNLLKRRIFYF